MKWSIAVGYYQGHIHGFRIYSNDVKASDLTHVEICSSPIYKVHAIKLKYEKMCQRRHKKICRLLLPNITFTLYVSEHTHTLIDE